MSRDPDVPPVSTERPYVDATDRSTEDLRAELEQLNNPLLDDAEASVRQAREELRATVSELAERLDVPAHARRRAVRARDTVVTAAGAHARLIVAGAGVLLMALVLRRRSAKNR